MDSYDTLGHARIFLAGSGNRLHPVAEHLEAPSLLRKALARTANPATIADLGFDPNGPMVSALSSIRWDVDSLNSPFDIELAVPDGEYWLNLFFFECCCDNRHFQIYVENELLAEDVHRAAYADALGDVGRYSFEGIEVTDGSLSISFVGIAGGDVNSILSAIEVLPGDFDPCDDENNPDFGRCAGNVQCFVDGPNKALGKPATQSSEGWGGNPERAVDGNTNGQWGAGTTTHTNGAPSWWEVDLLDTFDITEIVLWNRLDCCSERLTDFTITILDADGNVTFEEGGLDALSQASFSLEDIAASGQFVRISMPGAFMSITMNEMPLCLGTSGSVRTRTAPQSANSAKPPSSRGSSA